MTASRSQIEATMRYNKKTYKRIPLDVRLEEYEKLVNHKDATGESINGFFRRMIKENLK